MYLLHHENLQLYLRLGLKFNQSQWLKPNVELNTQKENRSRKKWIQGWESMVEIKGQCYIQHNNGKVSEIELM